MHIIKVNVHLFILSITAFALGTGISKIYLPFIVFSIVATAHKLLQIRRVNYASTFHFFCGISSPLLMISLGFERYGTSNPYFSVLSIVISLSFFYLASNLFRSSLMIDLINLYAIGSSFQTIVNLIYSFYFVPGGSLKAGYGVLFSPFSDSTLNTPEFATLLVPASIAFLFMGNKSKSVKLKVLSYFTYLILLFCSSVILASRTSLLLSIGIPFSLLMFKRILKASTYLYVNRRALALSFVVFFVISISFIFFYPLLETIFIRITTEGLSSPRISMFLDGLNKVSLYPFGGFQPDISTYSGSDLFHNIFIDTARIGGIFAVLPLLVSVFITIISSHRSFLCSNNSTTYLLLLYFCSLLVAFQGVPFQGAYQIYVLLFSISLTLPLPPFKFIESSL
jgi:hypothetical protein